MRPCSGGRRKEDGWLVSVYLGCCTRACVSALDVCTYIDRPPVWCCGCTHLTFPSLPGSCGARGGGAASSPGGQTGGSAVAVVCECDVLFILRQGLQAVRVRLGFESKSNESDGMGWNGTAVFLHPPPDHRRTQATHLEHGAQVLQGVELEGEFLRDAGVVDEPHQRKALGLELSQQRLRALLDVRLWDRRTRPNRFGSGRREV
jgi:hypothetical protein